MEAEEFIPLSKIQNQESIEENGNEKEKDDYKTKEHHFNTVSTPRYPIEFPEFESPPWKKSKYKKGLRGLHEEILDFEEYINPFQCEIDMREDVVKRIEKVAQTIWKDSEVQVFGSFFTNLYLPSSDIDLSVQNVPDRFPEILYILADRLNKAGISDDLSIISKAKVPIIKLVDSFSKCKVDISFNTDNGFQNSLIIQQYLLEYSPLRTLAIILKYFLQQRALNESYMGGIGSYALILMIASFLQQEKKVRGDNYGDDIGLLLIGFFRLYGKEFNYYTNGISLREGGYYFSKFSKSWYDYERPFLLSIEDPHDPDNDVSRNSFKILNVRRSFEFAYDRLVKQPIDEMNYTPTILSRILFVDHSLILYRENIKTLYNDKKSSEQ